MRSWKVGSALIHHPEGGTTDPACRPAPLLLVRNHRRGGLSDWSPPGGVIDPGEEILEGLRREVSEETGLEVRSWSDHLWTISAVAPDMGWSLDARIWRAAEVEGELSVGADPDGIVVDSAWVHADRLAELLGGGPRWVAEPLLEWVADPWSDHRTFRYVVRGSDLRTLRVERLP